MARPSERFALLDDRGSRVIVVLSDGRVLRPDGSLIVPGVGDDLLGQGLVLLDRTPVSIRLAGVDGRAVRRVEIDAGTLQIETDGVTSSVMLGGS